MKYPKEIRTFCPSCGSHQIHEVKIVKKRKASELKRGQRKFREVLKGYRGYPRPLPDREKTARRKDMRLQCKGCKKMHVKKRTFRTKKFELVKKSK